MDRDFGLAGVRLIFKLEFMQYSGAYKARGAFANLLLRKTPAVGIAAASGGNHGAAAAFAAMTLGVPATVFVPEISSPAKIARIRNYGAKLVITGKIYDDALTASEAFLKDSGAMSVHAFDSIETMLGAGTLALELDEAAPDLDIILASVGGGGLAGGLCGWYAGENEIIGVEPERAPTLYAALKAGRPVDVDVSGVAADSLGASRMGASNFPVVARHVRRSVLVSDADIVAAQKALWEKLRIVAEPGAAAALAPLLTGAVKPKRGASIGVILCGGNTKAVNFDQ